MVESSSLYACAKVLNTGVAPHPKREGQRTRRESTELPNSQCRQLPSLGKTFRNWNSQTRGRTCVDGEDRGPMTFGQVVGAEQSFSRVIHVATASSSSPGKFVNSIGVTPLPTSAHAESTEPQERRRVDPPPEALPPGPDREAEAPPSGTIKFAVVRSVTTWQINSQGPSRVTAESDAGLSSLAIQADLDPQLSVPKSRGLLSNEKAPWVVE